MKKRITEEQFIKILKRWVTGEKTKDLCRELSGNDSRCTVFRIQGYRALMLFFIHDYFFLMKV